MDSEAWRIIHIPEKPALPPDSQPTVKVYASVIKPKFANTIVRHLCKIVPLEDLRHVKRVRKKTLPDHGETQLTVILCLAPEHDMPPDVQKLVDPYELSPFITEVCKYAAVSKEEWEEQCKIWPTSFHPPTYNIDGIGGFSEEDTQSICKFMRLAIDLAVSGHKPLVNAAVIVDPSVRRIIASETDQVYQSSAPRDMTSTETMPFKETGESINCQNIDRVTNASSDICLNGILKKLNGSSSAVACLNPWQWSMQPHDSEKCSQWHPLRHASVVAIESSSARDRYLFPNSSENFGPDHSQPSSADSPAKKQKTKSHSPDVQNDSRGDALRDPSMERPYLCTGYDIFLLWEPCTMCAMALVHQRIKRIFYAFPNPTAGGLGSVHRLQGEKSLNHHYAVFRVLLPVPGETLVTVGSRIYVLSKSNVEMTSIDCSKSHTVQPLPSMRMFMYDMVAANFAGKVYVMGEIERRTHRVMMFDIETQMWELEMRMLHHDISCDMSGCVVMDDKMYMRAVADPENNFTRVIFEIKYY